MDMYGDKILALVCCTKRSGLAEGVVGNIPIAADDNGAAAADKCCAGERAIIKFILTPTLEKSAMYHEYLTTLNPFG
eukprot:365429-Chlamydomonas_euryale.AAC.7